MASNIVDVITPALQPSTPQLPEDTGVREEYCWEHPFHHKLLTLRFTGYLITAKDWRRKLVDLKGVDELLKAEEFDKLTELFKPPDFVEFVDSKNDKTLEKETYKEKCRREILTEYSRYRSTPVFKKCPKDADKLKEKSLKDAGELKEKYLPSKELEKWLQTDPSSPDKEPSPLAEVPPEYLNEEIDRRCEKGSEREFRIVFGRRDHHLVASLVEALWDMRKEGDIKIAYVPREQLLSVDMEQREIRELTLQLHPNKPVYKRRDKDEIRGFEEAFFDAMPWCRVPGGRNLSEIIDRDDYKLYKEISGRTEVEKIWIEDKWLMSERKRLYREERKKDKDKTPVKVTDPNDQVNHYLPILKEISGFKGLIRDDRFYEGLQGLIYIIQVVDKKEDPPDLRTHFEKLTSTELQYRRDLRKLKKIKRDEEKKKEPETKN